MANQRGKPPNCVDGVALHLNVAKGIKAYLKQLCATQLYGKNENEAAEQILNQEIKRLVISGELENLLAKRPMDTDGDGDATDVEKE